MIYNQSLLFKMGVTYYIIGLWLVAGTRAEIGLHLPTGGILYPHTSQVREVISLDGLWNFILDTKKQLGMSQKWFTKDISMMKGAMRMPVPSSYNDLTTLASVRDHIGLVWYDRKFFVPSSWRTQDFRVWLRFSSVNYFAHVWINGKKVIEHEIGHLPFREDIASFIKYGSENKLTVAVDNVLGPETVPQGYFEEMPTMKEPKRVQRYSFDFFNYAGIHRSVHLYTTPNVYIDDIDLTTEIQDGKAYIYYNLFYKGYSETDTINSTISVFSKDGHLDCFENSTVENGKGNISGRVEIEHPKFWWPFLMNPEPGYLYTIEISLYSWERGSTDIYRLPYGLRTLKWDSNSVYINHKPIYIRGFGRHEDADIRGKGFDLPTAVRDHNLLKWVGANAYRTSHYPYAEEIMDLAESQGIMIIDESPSVGTENFTQILIEKHKMAIAEMVNRDKNRVCVIMWSVANEAKSGDKGAGPYFGSVVSYLRTLDKTRPVTAVINRWYTVDQLAQFLDVICFNRYNAWYTSPGNLEVIQVAVETEAQYWRDKHVKPVVMSEFGADTYVGLHLLPEFVWSEEYQKTLLSEHFKAFDNLRKKGWFIGEMIWNFADFETDQWTTSVAGNKKGVFTRQRQPKSAAFLIRQRNYQLAFMLDGAKLPDELQRYTSDMKKC